MKRTYSIIAFASIVILVVTLGGCYGPNDPIKPYPWHKAESWYCEQIQMTIQFVYNEEGNLVDTEIASLHVNGKEYDVDIGFHQDSIHFMLDEDGDEYWESILEGQWIYRNGNMIVRIFEDKIFGGQFSELVFVPVTS